MSSVREREAFYWPRYLLKVQQDLTKEVHIVTRRAERLYGWIDRRWSATRLPAAFSIDVFPNVKRIVIEIRRSFFHDWESGAKLTSKQYRRVVNANISKITEYIKETKPNVNIVVRRTNLWRAITLPSTDLCRNFAHRS